jgi:hypothetical protein
MLEFELLKFVGVTEYDIFSFDALEQKVLMGWLG